MEIIYSKIPRGVRSDVYLVIMTLTNQHPLIFVVNVGKTTEIINTANILKN